MLEFDHFVFTDLSGEKKIKIIQKKKTLHKDDFLRKEDEKHHEHIWLSNNIKYSLKNMNDSIRQPEKPGKSGKILLNSLPQRRSKTEMKRRVSISCSIFAFIYKSQKESDKKKTIC